MSLHPNVAINSGTAVPADIALAVLAGQGFMTAITMRGPLTPVLSKSFAEWEANHGTSEHASGFGRVAAETFFRIGGQRLWTSRVTGPTPTTALVKLFDQSGAVDPGDVSLVFTATSPGAWANGATGGLSVEVETNGVTAGSYVLIVRLNGVEVDRSPELLDQAAAVTWSAKSKWGRITLGASAEDPRDAAPANLAGGADDVSNVTEADWTAALARFTMALGPGQVFAPGRTTTAAHTALDVHGATFDRTPRKDVANVTSAATLAASGVAQRSLATANAGGLFGPWAIVPGAVQGTTRLVPYSAVAAGVFARNLSKGMALGQASAGVEYGRPGPYVLGLAVNDDADPTTTKWTDADLDLLHQSGVNVAYRVDGQVQMMGYRTLVDEAVADEWVDLSGAELMHVIDSQMRGMLRRMQFRGIDKKRQYFARIEEQAIGILQPYYLAGQLFGNSPAEAFKVDAGPSVNSDASIAARKAGVEYAAITTPTAEQMAGSRIKVATGGTL